MPGEVVDTNVLVVATASEQGWRHPRVPVDDLAVQRRVYEWLRAFREDADRMFVLDFPQRTILAEYQRNLDAAHYGRRVIQHKIDTGACQIVGLEYWMNGNEHVAVLPDEVTHLLHDLGDRKLVAAAFSASAPIVNAADSDWTEAKVVEALELLGVTVVQLLSDDERAACRAH